MRFGKRQLPMRLRVARTIAYCQAAVLVLMAIFGLEVVGLGGSTDGVSLNGLMASPTLSGGGVMTYALVLFVAAVIVIAVEQQAGTHPASYRLALVGVELILSAYLILVVDNRYGSWIVGPACGVAVIALHYWPELRGHLHAPGAAEAAPASPEQTAPEMGSGTRGQAPPPL
jgi:hypothetical protein